MSLGRSPRRQPRLLCDGRASRPAAACQGDRRRGSRWTRNPASRAPAARCRRVFMPASCSRTCPPTSGPAPARARDRAGARLPGVLRPSPSARTSRAHRDVLRPRGGRRPRTSSCSSPRTSCSACVDVSPGGCHARALQHAQVPTRRGPSSATGQPGRPSSFARSTISLGKARVSARPSRTRTSPSAFARRPGCACTVGPPYERHRAPRLRRLRDPRRYPAHSEGSRRLPFHRACGGHGDVQPQQGPGRLPDREPRPHRAGRAAGGRGQLGVANSATGERGKLDASPPAPRLACLLDSRPKRSSVLSTGVIGVRLPSTSSSPGSGRPSRRCRPKVAPRRPRRS